MLGIYGPAQQIDTDAFWKHLMDINAILDFPWCVMGGLNQMACLSHKIAGT